MSTVCGHCGHDADRHLHGGRCWEEIPCAGIAHYCTCRRFRPLGLLLGLRVLGVFAACAVLGTLEGLIGGVGPR